MFVQKPMFLFACALWAVLFVSPQSFAQNTLTYTYDALGRVTFVTDNVNGNRDYDYDKAGNRLLVSIGNPTDATADPLSAPLPPTNAKSVPGPYGTFINSWSASAGATYYLLLINGSRIKLTTTSYQSSGIRGVNVEACNDANLCSDAVNLVAM